MSVESITWALKVPVPASSAKFVLVVLANQANDETGRSFPSIKYLSEATGQDRKTVISNLSKLIGWGLIEDSGERMGATKQVIVYRLLRSADLFVEASQKRNSSENGTVPKKDGNSPVFPRKQSQKRDTEPSFNHQEPEARADARSARGTRLPDSWEPTPNGLAFAESRLGAHAREEIEKFRDHWIAAPGARGVKLDWDATFRNWVRNARTTGVTHATSRKQSLAERVWNKSVAEELSDQRRLGAIGHDDARTLDPHVRDLPAQVVKCDG